MVVPHKVIQQGVIMKTTVSKFKVISVSMLMGMLITTPVRSEDIEIYVGSNPTAAQSAPNILFALDTSGSMTTEVDIIETVNGQYDSALVYSGSSYDATKIYYSNTNSTTDIDGEINSSNMDCNAAALDLNAYGFFTGRLAQYDGDNWSSISSQTRYTECELDSGIHGSSATSTKKYAVNGRSNRYSSNSILEVDWSVTGAVTTLYTGNYLNFLAAVDSGAITIITGTSSRIEVMKRVMRDVVNSSQGINIGLMRFDRGVTAGDAYADGGMIIKAMEPIASSRTAFLEKLDGLKGQGWTPLSEVLYEAGLYFRGLEVDYGDNSYGYNGVEELSVPESRIDLDQTTYKTPITSPCQKNHIVLLTDGQENAISNFNSSTSRKAKYNISGSCNKGSAGAPLCLSQVASYLNNEDVLPGMAQPQNVITHTIGFAFKDPFLQTTATAGGGLYRPASDYDSLTAAFKEIINTVNKTSSTFASPAVSVNAFNRTTNRSDLYFTLFKPASGPHWEGNFKRFKLEFNSQGIPSIVDQDGNLAIDPETGFFAETSRSYWSAAIDGADTELGGTASKMFAGSTLTASRKIYSNLTTTADLTDTGNRVEEDNTNITNSMLGVANDAEKANLIMWARGIDVDDNFGSFDANGNAEGNGSTTDARTAMGEPLHSQPALVEYGDGNTSAPNIVAYVATNDGYLHAFDTRSTAGTEKFAFIPKELMPGLKTIYDNSPSNGKQYGLDGNVTAYIKDVDRDGEIETDDQVIIYVGNRRGGQNYYALDVTNPDAPVYLWTLYGGQDNTVNDGRGDYTELGQTWSTPLVKKIRFNGADVPVLIFAGGYDVDQDGVTIRTADDVGRGIFIVDAISGSLLWRMGPDGPANLTDTNMIYSIPSDIAAADASGDGYVDHLYVGDMGGQLWRVDINNNLGDSVTNINLMMSGGRIADLADNTAESNRKFFYAPDLALLKDNADVSYLSVLITSGNRAHPLTKTVQDRAFMIRDLPIFEKPDTYETVTVNNTDEDLFDTTDNVIGQGVTAAERIAAFSELQAAKGWFFDFDVDTGEKGLTRPLIFQGEAFFATYVPELAAPGVCEPPGGRGFLYHISLSNAKPVKNYDTIGSDDELTFQDRKVNLVRSGIPADPTLIIPADGAAICVGTECSKAEANAGHKRVYWFEE